MLELTADGTWQESHYIVPVQIIDKSPVKVNLTKNIIAKYTLNFLSRKIMYNYDCDIIPVVCAYLGCILRSTIEWDPGNNSTYRILSPAHLMELMYIKCGIKTRSKMKQVGCKILIQKIDELLGHKYQTYDGKRVIFGNEYVIARLPINYAESACKIFNIPSEYESIFYDFASGRKLSKDVWNINYKPNYNINYAKKSESELFLDAKLMWDYGCICGFQCKSAHVINGMSIFWSSESDRAYLKNGYFKKMPESKEKFSAAMASINLTIEHLLSKNECKTLGINPNFAGNIYPACKTCNSSLSDKNIIEKLFMIKKCYPEPDEYIKDISNSFIIGLRQSGHYELCNVFAEQIRKEFDIIV